MSIPSQRHIQEGVDFDKKLMDAKVNDGIWIEQQKIMERRMMANEYSKETFQDNPPKAKTNKQEHLPMAFEPTVWATIAAMGFLLIVFSY